MTTVPSEVTTASWAVGSENGTSSARRGMSIAPSRHIALPSMSGENLILRPSRDILTRYLGLENRSDSIVEGDVLVTLPDTSPTEDSGDDALAMALTEITKIRIQWIYLLTDISVLALSACYIPLERLFYSLITVLLSGQIIGFICEVRLPWQRERLSTAS